MTLPAGTRVGPYEILAPIGAGGMGEVYRARDTRLDRDVAIKILPELFATDAERLARFEREAKTLASLNHPHIAQIYGVEETNGTRALVMELVEGGDLAQRLTRGAMSLDEALPVARQIISALEAAHEKGIVHRDLKPANIMLTADGAAKVLDFGLARAVEPESTSSISNSPTLTLAATQAGVILGTAAYMSPEQAKGRAADKRSDVWAFGCVLFEMLSGRRAFEGEDLSDTLAAVLRADPDWAALPAGVPGHITTLIRRCLIKDRKARIPDLSVVRFLLDEPPGPAAAPRPSGPIGPPARLQMLWLIATGLAGAAIAIAGTWLFLRPPDEPRHPLRFALDAASVVPIGAFDSDRPLAISPDGRSFVYVAWAGSTSQLMLRAMDRIEVRPLSGATGARAPFFSPDGKWIGYFQGTSEIKKVAVAGGPPVTIARINYLPRGASWGADNTIIFATSNALVGLMSVPASGGTPEPLTKPDLGRNETSHAYPSVLPDGRGVLFTVRNAQQVDGWEIAVLDFKTRKHKILFRGGTQPAYLDTGHLVYATAGTLRAVRFDLDRLEIAGDPVTILEQLAMGGTGAAAYTVSRTGTLVYLPGGLAASVNTRSLVWIDRRGRETPSGAPPRAYFALRLSPDGTRVALDIRDENSDVWVWDLARRTLARLTFDPGPDIFPIWTADSRRIIFRSGRAAAHSLFWQAADGTGVAERLTAPTDAHTPTSVSPDPMRIVFTESGGPRGDDVLMLPVDGDRRAVPLVQTTFRERNGAVSPDGRWLAYESDESTETQIYVRPFPAVDSGRWQVSPGGGSKASWSRDGRELFYLDGEGTLISVPIDGGPGFRAGEPVKLFAAVPSTNLVSGRSYDVSPDGRRFIVIKDPPRPNPAADRLPQMVVVLNWFEELKTRLPGR